MRGLKNKVQLLAPAETQKGAVFADSGCPFLPDLAEVQRAIKGGRDGGAVTMWSPERETGALVSVQRGPEGAPTTARCV